LKNRCFAAGLDAGALGPRPRQAEKGIPLGPERYGTLASKGKDKNQEHIDKNMEWQTEPEKNAWHVFYKDPDHVAMPMVGGEGAALVSRAGGAYMAHDGVVHKQGIVACKTEAKAQIDILAVAEKILVEPANGLERGCAVECGGGAG
jgi:hypothetical protein